MTRGRPPFSVFAIRAELPARQFFDDAVAEYSIDRAREKFEREYNHLAPFHWCGAVVFCRGQRPCEYTARGYPVVRSAESINEGEGE